MAPFDSTPSTTDYPVIAQLDRANVLVRIRLALQQRSQQRWSVTGGTGAAYGVLTIASAPERRTPAGTMTDEDRATLTLLLGLDALVGPEGALIDDSFDHYVEYVDRAEGRIPRVIGEPAPWLDTPAPR